ncbi:MAG: hypothetical protein A2Y40_07585 [Candidatus Margulisbacteria bacterium GWF2_35_9]|nr:MAG: hypothetical protein A2Y40_07585 [Candidatus Margulisbacteria bacterium GWF2_35_9]
MKKTNKFNNHYSFIVSFFVVLIAITVLSNLPNIRTNLFIPDLVLKNIAHVTVFFLLGFFYLNMLNNTRFKFATGIFIFFMLGIGFSLFDEFQQSFLPSRNVSFMDVLLDTLGLLLAFSLFRIINLFHQPISIKHKKKALLISSKGTAAKLYDYIYKDTNSEFSIKKVLIWDDSSLAPSQKEHRFYSSFEEIYQTVYHEKWDKIIVVGKDITKEKSDIVKDLAKRTNTEILFIG